MKVPMLADDQYGLTPEQFAAMPARLRERISTLDPATDATQIAKLEADIPVWEAAHEQLDGKDGKWAIEWTKLREGAAIIAEYGARNSKGDMGRIQAAHDTLVDLGATCKGAALTEGEAIEEAATYIVKAGRGKLERVLIAESGPGDPTEHIVTLREAGAMFDDANRTVTITPIRPGPGNRRDRNFYKPETLKAAVQEGKFSGVLMYANHPTPDELKKRPERDVTTWVGVVEETWWDEQRGRPRSRVKVVDEQVYHKWKAAPEHVAFSVLGQGRVRPGRVNGEDMRLVESIEKVASIDWVTQAGAGGAIDFAESARAAEEFEMDIEEIKAMTEAQLAALGLARIAEDDGEDDDGAVDPGSAADAGDGKAADAANADAANADAESAAKAEATTGSGTSSASAEAPEGTTPDGFVSIADYNKLKAQVDGLTTDVTKGKIKEAVADGQSRATTLLKTALKETAFPRAAREDIEARFAEASVGEGLIYPDDAAFTAAIAAEVTRMRKVVDGVVGRSSLVRNMGQPPADEPGSGQTFREAKEEALMARIFTDSLPEPRDAKGTPATEQMAESGSVKAIEDRIAARI